MIIADVQFMCLHVMLVGIWERAMGREPVRRLSEWLDSYIVISGDGAIITAGKRYKRIKH